MARQCYSTISDNSSKSTEHYQLPQWEGETITSWLTQMNYAMQRVDDVMWSLALRTGIDGLPDETVEEVVRLSNWSQQVDSELSTLKESVGNSLIAQGNIQTQITAMQTRLETITTNLVNLDTRMNTLESRVDNLQVGLSKLENNLNALTERVEALESSDSDEPENTE